MSHTHKGREIQEHPPHCPRPSHSAYGQSWKRSVNGHGADGQQARRNRRTGYHLCPLPIKGQPQRMHTPPLTKKFRVAGV